MKQLPFIIAVVALVGCGENRAISEWKEGQKARAKAAAEAKSQSAILEKAIRKSLKKPTGELTKADLEKVTDLSLMGNQLTDVKGLEKLTQLKVLWLGVNRLTDVKGLEKLTQLTWLELRFNPKLTKAQIDELQKALPKCKIFSNPTK